MPFAVSFDYKFDEGRLIVIARGLCGQEGIVPQLGRDCFMNSKIYISLPDPSIEEVAERAGVSKRRLKELKVIIADLNGSETSRRSKKAGKPSATRPSRPNAHS
jgi:hypothetical protein